MPPDRERPSHFDFGGPIALSISHHNALGKLARLGQACPPACDGEGVVGGDEIAIQKEQKSLLNLYGDVNLD